MATRPLPPLAEASYTSAKGGDVQLRRLRHKGTARALRTISPRVSSRPWRCEVILLTPYCWLSCASVGRRSPGCNCLMRWRRVCPVESCGRVVPTCLSFKSPPWRPLQSAFVRRIHAHNGHHDQDHKCHAQRFRRHFACLMEKSELRPPALPVSVVTAVVVMLVWVSNWFSSVAAGVRWASS